MLFHSLHLWQEFTWLKFTDWILPVASNRITRLSMLTCSYAFMRQQLLYRLQMSFIGEALCLLHCVVEVVLVSHDKGTMIVKVLR
jgi:hypothetical protein